MGIIKTLTYVSLPGRDLVIGFYEVVRAIVYVTDPASMESPDFFAFTETLRFVINLAEFLVATLSEALMDLVGDVLKLVFDLEGLVTGKMDPAACLIDMLKVMVQLLEQVEQIIFKLILNFPGVRVICSSIIQPIGEAVGIAAGLLCQVKLKLFACGKSLTKKLGSLCFLVKLLPERSGGEKLAGFAKLFGQAFAAGEKLKLTWLE